MFRMYALLLVFWGIIVAFSPLIGQEYLHRTFEGTRILTGHSLDAHRKGELGILLGIRSVDLNADEESTESPQLSGRLGLVYGLADWLGIQAGVNTLEHTVDGSLKIRMIRQGVEGGAPISMSYVGGFALRTQADSDSVRNMLFTNRLYYFHQLLLGSRVSDRFSFQLMPSLLHRNYAPSLNAKNDVFAMGIAARYRLTKTLAITMEYYRILPNQLADSRQNHASMGLAWSSGKYLTQFLVSNTQGMNERFMLSENTGDQQGGGIYAGINISRRVKLGKKWN